jgi:hypothetical protein
MNFRSNGFASGLTAAVLFASACGASQANTNCTFQLPPAAAEDFHVSDFSGQSQSYRFWGRHKICYADGATWTEAKTATTTVDLVQRATFYTPTDPAAAGAPKRPLIIWTHPNGGTEEFGYAPNATYANTVLLQSVLVPAMNAGYALASLEFRHPVGSYLVGQDFPGNTDIRDAIQYIKSKAADLNIDTNNIFLVGQSRGSLNMLWQMTSTTPAPGASGWHVQPWNVNAIWDYQAQTCYEKSTVGNKFILPGAERQKFNADPINPTLPVGLAGCAFADANTATVSLPHIRLMHDEGPTGGPEAYCSSNIDDYTCWLTYHDAAGLWNTYFDRHDANFGVALAQAYANSGNTAKISTCTGVAVFYDDVSGPHNGYAGYARFFDLHQSPPLASGVNPPCPDV